jgi:hypothetical protein
MNKHSEQLGELFGALAKAQAQIKTAVKDSTNPFFKSQYTSLDGCWATCREPLSSNGLTIIQTVHEEGARTYLCTILGHTSGQYIESTMPLLPGKPDPQSLGSALSYARRYSLCAIVGLTQGDDDGEEAMKGYREPQDSYYAKKTQQKPKEQAPEARERTVEEFVQELKDLDVGNNHFEAMSEYLDKLHKEKNVSIQKTMDQALRPDMIVRFVNSWKKWFEEEFSIPI